MHSVETLTADLDRLGVRNEDIVMVHASLKAIGPCVRGAVDVIEALDTAVGPDGVVMMVLGALDEFGWVNEHPAAERSRLLEDAPVFDAEHTPADPDTGMLAETFRQHPGTEVSDHPEGRFAARGSKAAALVADQPWDDYYGLGSPLDKLVKAGGRILRMGADLNTVTLTHLAEFRADLPDKRRVVRYRKVWGDRGPEVLPVETLDDVYGIFDYAGDDYFADLLSDYLSLGRAIEGMVGSASAELMESGDFVDFASDWLEDEFAEEAPGGD